MTRDRRYYLLLFGIGCSLRLLSIPLRGDFLGYDEALYATLAQSLLQGAGYTLNGLPHVHFPPGIPLLSAGVQMQIRDPARAMATLQAVASMAALVPIAIVLRRFLGPATARDAFALVCVAPALAFPLPFGHTYAEWFANGSELVFLGLLAAAFAILGRQDGRRAPAAVLGGAALGLATLVRDEGLFFLVPALGWLFLSGRRPMHRRLASRAVPALLLLFGCTLTLAPQVVRLHGLTGQWAVSGKATGVGPDDLLIDEIFTVLREDDWIPFIRKHHRLNAEGTRVGGFYDPNLGQKDPLLPHLASHCSSVVQNNVSLLPAVLTRLLPLPLWPLFAAGLYGWLRVLRARREPYGWWPVWLAFPAGVIFCAVPLHTRYVLFLVPLLLAGVAFGISEVLRWLHARGQPASALRKIRVCAVGGACGVLLLSELTSTTLALMGAPHAGTYQRDLGEILESEVEGRGPIMSHHPHAALFARRDWTLLPFDTFDRIVGYAHHRGVQHILLTPLHVNHGDLPFSAVLPDGAIGSFALIKLSPARAAEWSFRVGRRYYLRTGSRWFDVDATLTTIELSGP